MILGLYNNFLNSSFQLLQNNDLKEWTEINLQKMKKIRWSVIVREGGIFLIWDKVRYWVSIQILETKEKRKFRCRCLFFCCPSLTVQSFHLAFLKYMFSVVLIKINLFKVEIFWYSFVIIMCRTLKCWTTVNSIKHL